MAVAGIGTDIVRIERFRRLLSAEKQGVIARLFTSGEQQYCLAKKDPAPHLAARFAAKEAFLKALGTGLRNGLSWQDVEIARDELGKPWLRLGGQAAAMCARQAIGRVHLSYSHDGDYAQAVVVMESQ